VKLGEDKKKIRQDERHGKNALKGTIENQVKERGRENKAKLFKGGKRIRLQA